MTKAKAPTKKKKIEEVEETEVLDIEIDQNQMTLDDLEMLSMHDNGIEVPEWKLISFLKRIVINQDIGKVTIDKIQPLVEAIFAKIRETGNEEVEGKN